MESIVALGFRLCDFPPCHPERIPPRFHSALPRAFGCSQKFDRLRMTPCGVGGRSRNPSVTRIKWHKVSFGISVGNAGGCAIDPAKSWNNVEIFRKIREDGILPYIAQRTSVTEQNAGNYAVFCRQKDNRTFEQDQRKGLGKLQVLCDYLLFLFLRLAFWLYCSVPSSRIGLKKYGWLLTS